jgi:hypothetical protein
VSLAREGQSRGVTLPWGGQEGVEKGALEGVVARSMGRNLRGRPGRGKGQLARADSDGQRPKGHRPVVALAHS